MKAKRTLMSTIVFLTVFCISAFFNIQGPFFTTQGDNSKTKDVLLTESNALVDGNKEIEIQSFSYNANSVTTSLVDPNFTSREPNVTQAETNSVQKDKSLTKEITTTDNISKKASDVSLEESNQISLMAISDAYSELPEGEASAEESNPSETTNSPLDDTKKASEPKEPKPLYSNIGISVANSFVNIRDEASTSSNIIGKLYRDSAVEILDTKGDWYYVESGSVNGYVTSEYIKTGLSDDELVEKYSILRVTVTVDGLNVREKPAAESEKLTVVYQNETFPVVDLQEEWVKIDVTDDKVIGYVKREFAELVVDFKKAVSKEEEQELLTLQAKERAKKETEVKYRDGVSYSEEDIKLLACLVHSESGTQSYEGKLAVANVVLNRVKSSRYPNTIKAVIYQSGQFSVASSGSLTKQLSIYDHYSSKSQLLSVKAAKAALEGANNIGSRLYFHSYKAAAKKGYDEKPGSVKIQDHLFW